MTNKANPEREQTNSAETQSRACEEDAKHLTIDQRIDQRLKAYEDNALITQRESDKQRAEMERLLDADEHMKKMLAAIKLPNKWNYSAAGSLSKDLVSKHLNSQKTGMHAMYPILCNGAGCPYSSTCFAYQNNIHPPIGEPCVMETTKMENLLIQYDKDFHFDECSATDMLAIQELVHLDIMIDRCNSLIAQELTPVIEVNIGSSPQTGDVITQPAVSKYYEAYEKMSKRREAIEEGLMATRKSKKHDKVDNSKLEIDHLKAAFADASFFEIEQKPEGLA